MSTSTVPSVLHIITGLGDGGAEAALYTLATRDPKSEHIVVSLMGEGKYGPLLKATGISVTTLGMPRGKITIRGVRKLIRVLRHIQPDVVQTWMYHADLVGGVSARLVGIRNISWGVRHSFLLSGESSWSTILISRVNALLSRVVPKTIVCCAEKALEAHASIGYQRKKMTVIPNGYDMSVYFPDRAKRDTTRAHLGVEDDVPLLGFVARFDPLKDHGTLIRALELVREEIPQIHMVLVGTGVDATNSSLMSMLESTNLDSNVTLLGGRDDIPAIMNALDVHVMSSISEAFPNVLAEAMACGTPCVSTDVGDAPTIIGQTGWIVARENPREMANAIIEALNVKRNGDWQSVCDKAVQRVRDNFQFTTMVRRYRAEAWQLTEGDEHIEHC